MKIDKNTLAPKDLIMTVLDVDKTINENYSSSPQLDDIEIDHINLSADLKFQDQLPSSIPSTLT